MGETRRRLDSLTGLRAVAAFVVFLYHAQLFAGAIPHFGAVSGQGSLGVSFFFILSGFVLTWTYREGALARAFYRNRAARVLPAYYVAAIAGVGVCLVDATASLHTIWPNFFLIQPWFSDQNVAFGGNGVGWTLGVELVFYALFPLAHRQVKRFNVHGLWITLLVLIILTIGWSLAIDPKSVLGVRYWAVDELPLARLPEFLMGIVIAKLLSAGAIPRIPLWFACLLAGVVYLLDPHVPLAVRIVAFGVIPFVMLVASAAQTDLAGSPSPFRSRLMVTLGTWSFCFYLVHQLCIRLILAASPHVSGVPDLVWLLASLGFALIAAILLCEFIEKPFERRLRSDHQLPVIVSAT